MITRIIFNNNLQCKASQDTGLRKMTIASLPGIPENYCLPGSYSLSEQYTARNTPNIITGNASYPKNNINGNNRPRVLHVEDNHEIRFLVQILLRKDFEVVGIESGEKALEMMKSGDYDIILMDLHLGDGISGFEATSKIKAINEKTKLIPVIALTANNYHDVREECLKAGMNAFIQKPFDRADLTHTINELIAS